LKDNLMRSSAISWR